MLLCSWTVVIYVARVLNNIGQLYSITHREKEAEAKLMQAIAIAKKLQHPDRAQFLHNLAILYKNQQKFTQAEMLFKEAIEIKERLKEPLSTAQSMVQLGVLYTQLKQFTLSEDMHKKVLAIRELYLGRDHYLYKKTVEMLDDVHKQMGLKSQTHILWSTSENAFEADEFAPETPARVEPMEIVKEEEDKDKDQADDMEAKDKGKAKDKKHKEKHKHKHKHHTHKHKEKHKHKHKQKDKGGDNSPKRTKLVEHKD